MVHIYCGNGKGKTTAALGLCIRCVGSGKNVTFVQFLKNSKGSEICFLKNIENITIRCFQETVNGFFFSMSDEDKKALKAETEKGFEYVQSILKSGESDMVILDEIGGAIENGLISEDDVLEIIKNFGVKTEIVLTGRKFPENIIKFSDYVSEICEIKHPYTKGIMPRKGIEY